MAHAIVGICTLELHLPGVGSLKEKRSILKSLMARARQQFNVAAAEVDYQDSWQSAVIAMTTVSNSTQHVNSMLSHLINWIEENFPDAMLVQETIEIL